MWRVHSIQKRHCSLVSRRHLTPGPEEEAKADQGRGVSQGRLSLMRTSRRPRRIVVDEDLGGGQGGLSLGIPDQAFIAFGVEREDEEANMGITTDGDEGRSGRNVFGQFRGGV